MIIWLVSTALDRFSIYFPLFCSHLDLRCRMVNAVRFSSYAQDRSEGSKPVQPISVWHYSQALKYDYIFNKLKRRFTSFKNKFIFFNSTPAKILVLDLNNRFVFHRIWINECITLSDSIRLLRIGGQDRTPYSPGRCRI